jgi:carbonic anhydrase
MRVRLALALIALAFVTAEAGETTRHWAYSGPNGPANWGETCAGGKSQSPIDIGTASATHQKVAPLAFRYRPTALHIIDNGHSIQVDVDKGSTLAAGAARFSLVQFHFHKPSEEAIDGRRSAMVLHLVHRSAEGELAVVAVLLREGAANSLVSTLWRNFPKHKAHEESPTGVTINPSRLLPTERSYFSYVGSLTTPPCTEGVRWFVLKSPVSLSTAEIGTFANLYPANARPLQRVNGRQIVTN